MADKKPIKATYSGTDSTGLAEFVAADTIGVADGGTGLTTVATSSLLTGNGALALSAEANLTFDGSTLAVAGTASTSGNMGVGNADLGSTYFAGQHLLVGDEDASTGDTTAAVVVATKVAGTGGI